MRKITINKLVLAVYMSVAVWVILSRVQMKDYYAVTQGIIALLMIPLPVIIEKLAKIKIKSNIKTVYYIFCFFSIICGSALRWYGQVPGWDKLLHFASGFLMAFVGIAFFNAWRPLVTLQEKKDWVFLVVYGTMFTLGGAVIWEFYEYILYVGFGIDALNVETTGVHDTIQDMLVCGIGGIITSIWVVFQIKKKDTLEFLKIQ